MFVEIIQIWTRNIPIHPIKINLNIKLIWCINLNILFFQLKKKTTHHQMTHLSRQYYQYRLKVDKTMHIIQWYKLTVA